MAKNNPIDIQVGANIKTLRTLRGVTRSELADHLDIKQQAIEKYETGENRISASTLIKIAFYLHASIPEFLHGVDLVLDGSAPEISLHNKTDQDMLKHYHDLKSPEVQAALRNLASAIVGELAAIYTRRK
jgi:transcriptional regulator with XRE-family HTH domain